MLYIAGFSALAAAALGADCDNKTPISSRPIPVLDSLAAEAQPTTVAVGETVVFTATGTLHDESQPEEPFDQDMTALVLWDSSDPDILLVSPDGRATAKAAGTVTVVARTPDDGSVQGAGIESEAIDITVTAN